MKNNPEQLYRQRIATGELSPDPAQARAVQALDRLFDEIMEAHDRPKATLFERITGMAKRGPDAPEGVYMHGGVGRGKSMLMELFMECLTDDLKKRRVHFHEFMIEVHDYIHSRREAVGGSQGVDMAIPLLAERIAEQSRILCFDEFHVTDVADAMILGRLFTALFGRDVIVVATSNWEPERLYEGGLQRDRFLPFIELLKRRLEVVHLDSATDYRLGGLSDEERYITPLGRAANAKMKALFKALSGGAKVKKEVITVKGRDILIREAAGNVAHIPFSELCEKPHGAEDYLAIAKRFDTVLLSGVPKLGYDRRNEAKRLMTLIDVLYEAGTRLVVSADAEPDKLYRGHDHEFEFARTISRQMEMTRLKIDT